MKEPEPRYLAGEPSRIAILTKFWKIRFIGSPFIEGIQFPFRQTSMFVTLISIIHKKSLFTKKVGVCQTIPEGNFVLSMKLYEGRARRSEAQGIRRNIP